MTKEKLFLALCKEGLSPDEALNVSYNFKEGLRLLNKMIGMDKVIEEKKRQQSLDFNVEHI